MLVGLRQQEVEVDKAKDSSTELAELSGETKISVSVQQVTSRFQSIQSTAKVCTDLNILQLDALKL